VDVGLSTVTRMAREDTRWFVIGVVTLSFVIFLALPIAALIVIDHLRIRNEVRQERREIRQEIGELKKLKQEVRKYQDERVNSVVDESPNSTSDRGRN
jgi:hypothetical protein